MKCDMLIGRDAFALGWVATRKFLEERDDMQQIVTMGRTYIEPSPTSTKIIPFMLNEFRECFSAFKAF